MNSFEWNKIIGAILGTLLLVMGVGFVADAIYAPIEGRGPGYDLPGQAEPGSEEGRVEVVAIVQTPLAVLLASASSDKGSSVARKCQACHNFEIGGGNKTGPALFGVVGASIGANETFSYSDALNQMGADGETWTFEKLNDFLAAPKTAIPGTKMSFGGLSKETERADLLSFMQTLSANPVAFPVVESEDSVATSDPVTTEETAPIATAQATETQTPAAPESEPAQSAAQEGGLTVFETLLANASAEKGAQAARSCSACHTVDQGGANKFGPALFDIVGANIGGNETYNYSDVLAELGSKGETWSFENLDAFLLKPSDFASGTKMPFAGIPKDEERADLLAYLRTLSSDPVDLPGASGAPVAIEQTPVSEPEPAPEPVAQAAPTVALTPAQAAFSALLANASVDAGSEVSRKCRACHNFDQGAGNKFGPGLYDIVGAPVASNSSYSYSDVLVQMGSDGAAWSFENLDAFLTNPNAFTPGTKMPFAGLPSETERADLLVYLGSLSSNPVPLP